MAADAGAPPSGTATPPTPPPGTPPGVPDPKVSGAIAGLGLGTPPVTETPPVTTGTPLSALLPDEFKTHPAYDKFKDKDLATLFRSYGDLEKTIGAKPQGVMPLPNTPTAEQITAYHQALGIPETPDKYALELPAYPDGAPLPDDSVQWWRESAHRHHLTPAQIQGILNDHAGLIAKQWDGLMTERTAQRQELGTLLQQAFGVNAEPAVHVAFEHLRREYPDVVDDFFHGTITEGIAQPLGPKGLVALVKILQSNAKLTGNDVFVQGDGRGGFLNAETALTQITELRAQFADKKISEEDYKREHERLAKVAYGT